MKDETKGTIFAIVFTCLIFGGCIFMGISCASQPHISKDPEYSKHVTLYSDGEIVKEWDTMGSVHEYDGKFSFYDVETEGWVEITGSVIVESTVNQ